MVKIMVLFNLNKKTEIKWFVNKKPGNVELTDKFIRVSTKHPRLEYVVFYKDIVDIKKGKKCIRISNKSDKYTMSIVSGGEAVIDETYMTILEKISE